MHINAILPFGSYDLQHNALIFFPRTTNSLQNEASKHDPAAAAHLVAHRKILAVLRAPADSAVQALVDIAVPLVRAVATVVPAVAEAPLGDAAAVRAHEEGAVAQASWREESERASQ